MKKRGDKFPNLIGVTFAEIARVIQTLWLLYQILDLGSQIHFRGRRSMFSNSQGLSLIGSNLEQYLNQFQRKSLKLLENILLQQIQDTFSIQVRLKAQFFKAYSKVKNPKFGSFSRAPEDFEGLRSRKEKITKTPSFFGQKIK